MQQNPKTNIYGSKQNIEINAIRLKNRFQGANQTNKKHSQQCNNEKQIKN